MDLNNLIVEWSICDQKIKENNAITKNLREKKSQLSEYVIKEIEDNNMTESVFEIPNMNTTVSYKQTTVAKPITYDFLNICFKEFFYGEDTCEKLIEFIKKKREKINKKILHSSDL
jgi:hypothetical protein